MEDNSLLERCLVANRTDCSVEVSIESKPRSWWLEEPGKLGRSQMEKDLRSPMVEIAVEYSAINFKDALAVDFEGKVARRTQLVPGIDIVGRVLSIQSDIHEQSKDSSALTEESSLLRVGDYVVSTGYELGVAWHGGFSTYARVPSAWVIPIPQSLKPIDAAILGTAGMTAWRSVQAIKSSGIEPEHGAVIVSGASGGVGSLAVLLLAQLGYEVVASSGKPQFHSWLKSLGASSCIDRIGRQAGELKPLANEKWSAGIDVAGGNTLSTMISSIKYNGCVAASGMAESTSLNSSVFPLILRGVRLIGIESAYVELSEKKTVWDSLSALNLDLGAICSSQVELDDLPELLVKFRNSSQHGRTVVVI